MIALSAILFSGCSPLFSECLTLSQKFQRVFDVYFVGRSKESLIKIFGVPDETHRIGDKTELKYNYTSTYTVPAHSTSQTKTNYNYGKVGSSYYYDYYGKKSENSQTTTTYQPSQTYNTTHYIKFFVRDNTCFNYTYFIGKPYMRTWVKRCRNLFDRKKFKDYIGKKQAEKSIAEKEGYKDMIIDKYGNITGYREVDAWNKNKINVYNKDGSKIASLKYGKVKSQ